MDLSGELLSQAVKATFERRKTPITTKPLYLFSNDFTQDKSKHTQWGAFKNNNSLNIKTDFAETVYEIQNLLEPIYQSIAVQKIFTRKWLSDEFKWKEI